MLAYATIGTNDMDRAVAFYDALLVEIGAKQLFGMDRIKFYGKSTDGAMLALCIPYDEKPHGGDEIRPAGEDDRHGCRFRPEGAHGRTSASRVRSPAKGANRFSVSCAALAEPRRSPPSEPSPRAGFTRNRGETRQSKGTAAATLPPRRGARQT